jgi:3'5'-cyclic nucleotide phosphodiesterase
MCSQKTADLLMCAGYEHWLSPRSTLSSIKGKGDMQCYWVNPNAKDTGSKLIQRRGTNSSQPKESTFNQKRHEILIEWVTDMLQGLLLEVASSRFLAREKSNKSEWMLLDEMVFVSPRDEVSETITIPRAADEEATSDDTIPVLPPEVVSQLFDYVSMIASWYKENAFHNFEHAAHVVMASKKLLKRVVKPVESHSSATAYGITSDPLTQFAILFSALIHDVDHPGVSNAQLVKENSPIAVLYHEKSVAEQNSVTISWDLLMQLQFDDLRFATEECKRFRQLIVNAVLATDLFDADLKLLRENRWNKAFNNPIADDTLSSLESGMIEDDTNWRATIVIEPIIQAADVSHTKQHWHIYQKRNNLLFEEMYHAYTEGRSDKDPSVDWYTGELWFFDNYIIPLAMKLKTCGVFGVSCDELLEYATANRQEWASKGEEIVLQKIVMIKENSSKEVS